MNGIVPFHQRVDAKAQVRENLWNDLKRRLDLMKADGATACRIDMWWGLIEPEKGQFDWEFPDRVIREIVAAGLEPYPILCYNPAWAPDRSPATDEDRRDFADYARALRGPYQAQVTAGDVSNAPNSSAFWAPEPDPQNYAALLREVYAAAKQANPNCKIVGMCTAGPDYAFIEGVYREGAAAWMDAVSYHNYDARAEDDVLTEEIRRIRRIMELYGDAAKPLLITEIGLSTGKSPVLPEVSQAYQASWMVKKTLLALAGGVDQFYYFKLVDDDPSYAPDGFWGLYDWNFKAKRSAAAYRAMTARLSDARFVGRARRLSNDDERPEDAVVLLFRKGEETLAIAWTRNDSADLQIALPADAPLLVEDLLGQPAGELKPGADGLAIARIGAEPVYIRNLPVRALPLATVRFRPEVVYLSAGETRDVTLFIENPTDAPLEVDLGPMLSPPERGGLKITSPREKVICPAGRSVSALVTLKLAAGAAPFRLLRVQMCDPGNYSYGLDVSSAQPFEIAFLAEPREKDYALTTFVRNLLGRPVSGLVRWELEEQGPAGARPLNGLRPGASASLARGMKAAHKPARITVRVEENGGAAAEGSIRGWGQPILKTPPAIDGDLNDWGNVTGLTLTPEVFQLDAGGNPMKASEFHATMKFAWTADHLYVAADITDSTPLVNPHEGTQIWRGDGLELYLGFGGHSRDFGYTPRHYQIGITPGDEGENPYVWNWRARDAEGRPVPDGARVEGAEVAVQRFDSGYRLEAAIPLAAFGETIAPRQVIGFDFAVNNQADPKAEKKEATMMWSGGPVNWRNPSGWGFAVLLPE